MNEDGDKGDRRTGTKMMPMTGRDRRKATSLLLQLQLESQLRQQNVEPEEMEDPQVEHTYPLFDENTNADGPTVMGEKAVGDERADGGIEEWRRELQIMLFLNLKGEMEGLDGFRGSGGRGVAGWVEGSLGEIVGILGEKGGRVG